MNDNVSARNQNTSVGIEPVAGSVYGNVAAGNYDVFRDRIIVACRVDAVVVSIDRKRTAVYKCVSAVAMDRVVRRIDRKRSAFDQNRVIRIARNGSVVFVVAVGVVLDFADFYTFCALNEGVTIV